MRGQVLVLFISYQENLLPASLTIQILTTFRSQPEPPAIRKFQLTLMFPFGLGAET